MIPAYSPQARGRSERSFGTWQSRLPRELRIAGVRTLEAANQLLRERYSAEFNRKFAVQALQPGSAIRWTTAAPSQSGTAGGRSTSAAGEERWPGKL